MRKIKSQSKKETKTKKLKSKKAQLTMFVILGVVLLTVIGFAFYARMVILQDNLREEAEQAVSDYLQANSINYYVSDCLEKVSNKVIIDIGKTGGRTESFEDLTIGEDYIDYGGDNITYGLTENDFCDDVETQTPFYPKINTKLADLATIGTYTCAGEMINGYLGYQSLPRLCDFNGYNNFIWAIDQDHTCKFLHNYNPQREESIQGRIGIKIAEEIPKCLDLSIYTDDLGHSINLAEEQINAEAIYGRDDVTIIGTIPFTVSIRGHKPIITKRTFKYTAPIRIKEMYYFISKFLGKESIYYDYNAKQDYQALDYYDPSYKVEYIEDACEHCEFSGQNDDLLIVEDTLTQIDAENFKFQTAIKNRKPALDYIHEGETRYDLQVVQGEKITITPNGYDPDDTGIVYFYDGWKEDYDTTFNMECARQIFENPSNTDKDYSSCMTNILEEPENKWTTSELYEQTNKDVEMETTQNDIGPHTVRVSVREDGQDYYNDYQDVSILVFDLPVAVPEGENGFAGLNQSIASIEDPYTLSSEKSQESMIANQRLTDHYWEIYDEIGNMEFFIDTPQRLFKLPYDYNTLTPSQWQGEINLGGLIPPNNNANADETNDIKKANFKTPGKKTLSLTVQTNQYSSDPATHEIMVYNCLPIRKLDDEGNVDEEMFPYTTSSDYSHMCCDGGASINEDGNIDGTPAYAEPNTICFDETYYGYYERIRNYHNYGIPQYQIVYTANDINANTLQGITPRSNDGNDIYSKQISRNCPTDRGNICSGAVTETYDKSDSCNDFDPLEEEDERCEGPISTSLLTQFKSCYQYNNFQTFETRFRLNDRNGQPANGICNENWKCSNIGSDGYDDSGANRYVSKAICGGGSCQTTPSLDQLEEPDEQGIYTHNGIPVLQDCQSLDKTVCENSQRNQYVYSCQENPAQDDKCVYTLTTLWDGNKCQDQNGLESNYCDGSDHRQCESNECCGENQHGSPCFDICQDTHGSVLDEECIIERICGDNPLCNIQNEGYSCSTDSNNEAGYCTTNAECTRKIGEGETCNQDYECQTPFTCEPNEGEEETGSSCQ